jgi:hypothetical protein
MVLGVARQKESDVTADGVDLNYVERPECLPATVTERDSCCAFSAHWTQPLKPMRSMELTLPRTPKNLPKDYQRIVDGCVAWLALCGKTEDQIVAECRKTTPIPNLNTPLDPQFISNQGFTGLSPVQKLIVATVNGHPDKKLPRYVQKFYYLHFDNKGFFDEFEETIKQSVPRPVEV